MAKGPFAAVPFLPVVFVTAFGQAVLADDGCDVLRERVTTSVHAAMESRADRPMRLALSSTLSSAQSLARSSDRAGAVGSIVSGRQLCAKTVEVTTRAFSEALSALDMPVSWNSSPMNSGDYCRSHDLRQCHATPYPLAQTLSPNQSAFIHDAWKGVQNAIASQMPYGTERDLAEFTSGSLVSALWSNLTGLVEWPLYSSQPPPVARR